MPAAQLILKPGRERSVINRHPWIFSGALASEPTANSVEPGALLPVLAHDGTLLGQAFWSPASSIRARMLTWGTSPLSAPSALTVLLDLTWEWRQAWLQTYPSSTQPTGYRLVNAEGDGLPGLTIDWYNGLAVLQIGSLGIDKLKPNILSWLTDHGTQAVYEKSLAPSRTLEGLQPEEGWITPELSMPHPFSENGLQYLVDVVGGQKTGFFFDQRSMRSQIEQWSRGRSVLNTYCYTGGFSLAALRGGARHVTSVDSSQPALDMVERHVALNAFTNQNYHTIRADIPTYLRETALSTFDLIILDPPAFAKRRHDVPAALRAYRDINHLVFSKAQPGTLLLTCSCSAVLDQALFQKVIFQAAAGCNRSVQVLDTHHQAPDHPYSLFHPEGSYLKSLLLAIRE